MSSSTWNVQPATGEWNTAGNWTPSEPPTDTASFSRSSQTTITFTPTGNATVKRIEFAAEAPAYTFRFGSSHTPALTITGSGISNHSGTCQSFIVSAATRGYENPQLKFTGSATAGGADVFYSAGPVTEQDYGGGVISFCDQCSAGSASFKVWTGAGAPPEHSTVGGEVSFSDSASAASARFTIYGTLGKDGDTFGNVVFHDKATAADATFTNVGGTVARGDGGNTQFYGDSSAACGTFHNQGATVAQANGGDVAFDATADGGHGRFYNYAAKAAGGYGGVTSFNNNPPKATAGGASAGHGTYFNFGARDGELGGGGHVEFSAKHGSPSAANGTFFNYGSAIEGESSAGHAIFSISLPSDFFPTAGNGTFYNHPGTAKGAAAGFTEFSVFGTGSSSGNVPTAGEATFVNLGGYTAGASGGYTSFSGNSSAGNATLIAHGGTHGGYGGRIAFSNDASGGSASVLLYGNGELEIGYHSGGLTIGGLEMTGGIVSTQLGTKLPTLTLTSGLTLHASEAGFAFRKQDKGGFQFNTPYTILTAPNLSSYTAARFNGNEIDGVEPTFTIVGNDLQVSFNR